MNVESLETIYSLRPFSTKIPSCYLSRRKHIRTIFYLPLKNITVSCRTVGCLSCSGLGTMILPLFPILNVWCSSLQLELSSLYKYHIGTDGGNIPWEMMPAEINFWSPYSQGQELSVILWKKRTEPAYSS